MAKLNEILGAAGRLQDGLARKFGIQTGAPSPQLTPEIQPVHDFNTRDEEPIYRIRRFSAGTNVAALAANNDMWELFNPSNSGVIATIENVLVESELAGADIVFAGIQPITGVAQLAPFFGAGAVAFADSRLGGSSAIQAKAAAANIALMVNRSFQMRLQQGVALLIPFRHVIAPGASFMVGLNTANVQGWASFQWSERPLAQGENLTF